MDKNEVMQALNCSVNADFNLQSVDSQSGDLNSSYQGVDSNNYSCWDYWQNNYYPTIIRESYPIYISERAKDKGKQAFEIIKILKDKKLVKIEKVSNFIDLMDTLIAIL